MEWRSGRRSSNVEDRRGMGGMRMGGGAMRVGGGIGGLGLVGILVVSWLLGIDPSMIIGAIDGGAPVETRQELPRQGGGAGDEQAEFTSAVLASTEDVWHELFQADGQTYQEPGLVLFTDATQSGCGFAQGATGPFYCPGDRKVYLDLGFFDELSQRFGAPGDFAQAYVIAHEVGHHVQNLLGILPQVHEAQAGADRASANALSVRVELQADCLAGVWANRADRSRGVIEPGDVEEALDAAASVGDDRIMRAAGRRASPESFTHGSSEQRVEWFTRGLQSGEVSDCNTFG
ncbi:KPN_02809 family neutral zinc metallopeptidase [Geminicoccus harenae]|uniref:KPN_02809 family neutral zinc metallopeptidase n=1 Tax=Geminicoccus harenae TaxID=2498453 RepID=UPI00168AEBA5|nr:neutral zinc metallopeptidase [Geminicoccus harenae]